MLVTMREAVKAAQRVLLATQPGIRADGWWGTYTQEAFVKSKPEVQTLVRSVMSASNSSPEAAFKQTREDRKSAVVSDEYYRSLADRYMGKSKVDISKLTSLSPAARVLAMRASSEGITGSSLANFLANVEVESKFRPAREVMYTNVESVWRAMPRTKRLSAEQVSALIKGGRDVFFEAIYTNVPSAPLGKVNPSLGNTKPGWGAKYYGRGMKQMTGAYNYERFARAYPQYNAFENPDVLVTDVNAAMDSAIFFWKTDVMMKGVDKDIVKASQVVNGGSNGLDQRVALSKKYASVLA